MILIDSLYIHNSGGKTLLKVLIDTIVKSTKNNYWFLFDRRIDKNLLDSIDRHKITFLDASLYQRGKFYKHHHHSFNAVFCFGNVPPPISINQRVVIYFQNDLILSSNATGLSLKTKLLLFLKKRYISFKNKPSYLWAVQTSLMQEKLSISLGIKTERIKVLPFFETLACEGQSNPKKNSFLYVAGPEAHKNHQKLLLGFSLAAKQSKTPLTLSLTLPPNIFSSLSENFHTSSSKLEIHNLGILTKEGVINSYKENSFCIYPSLKESFGLPLIEAAQLGNQVIAADLPYVYEVIKPSLTFDPYSTQSISNAILKAIETDNLPETKVLVENKLNNFMNFIIN